MTLLAGFPADAGVRERVLVLVTVLIIAGCSPTDVGGVGDASSPLPKASRPADVSSPSPLPSGSTPPPLAWLDHVFDELDGYHYVSVTAEGQADILRKMQLAVGDPRTIRASITKLVSRRPAHISRSSDVIAQVIALALDRRLLSPETAPKVFLEGLAVGSATTRRTKHAGKTVWHVTDDAETEAFAFIEQAGTLVLAFGPSAEPVGEIANQLIEDRD